MSAKSKIHVSVFVALADPTRCRILEMLQAGPQPVHVLASGFAISRPAISRHLRVLKQARLISEDKKGRENLYRLHRDRLKPARTWIENLLPVTGAVLPAAVAVEAVPPQVETPPEPILVPVAEVEIAPAPPQATAPKPRKPVPPPQPAPVSQMGFDF